MIRVGLKLMAYLVVFLGFAVLIPTLILSGYFSIDGYFLYHPTHQRPQTSMRSWGVRGVFEGYCRPVADPSCVWLYCHGNAGQASEREYFLSCVSEGAAVYLLEYPGYGARPGTPSMESINGSALEALRELRRLHPGKVIGVVGESLGSGPASWLCTQENPPDRLVLIVPFDNLLSVAKEHFPWLPVDRLLRDGRWDNVAALRGYKGPVRIYGARYDKVVKVGHARFLASTLPGAQYTEMASEHSNWMDGDWVRLPDRW